MRETEEKAQESENECERTTVVTKKTNLPKIQPA